MSNNHNALVRKSQLSPSKLAVLQKRLQGKQSTVDFNIPRAEGKVPLSFSQQRIWFISQLKGDGASYHMGYKIYLRGQLDIEAIARSLEEIIFRHDILRTAYVVEDSQPVQVVRSAFDCLTLVEWKDLSEDIQSCSLDSWVRSEVVAPFNLSEGRPIRTTLVRLNEDEHVLVLTVHHIAFDGWSVGILIREFATLYEAFKHRQVSPLNDLPVQFGDYANWQRQCFDGGVFKTQIDYWKIQLEGSVPTELPTDRIRPAEFSSHGFNHRRTIPPLTVTKLQELSRHKKCSSFSLYLTALMVLLHRYTGQTDLMIGTAVANRNRSQLENLIGCFLNLLIIRGRIDPKDSFFVHLEHIHETVLEAFEHQDLPFEKLVEELRPERNLSRNPIFQVALVLHNAPIPQLELADIRIDAQEVDMGITRFDITLHLTETPEGLLSCFEYSTDLFDEATIARMAENYQILLESIVTAPGTALRDLPLISEEDRERVLNRWNVTAVDYPKELCLHEMFEAQAAKFPEAVAVICGERTLTYGELSARTDQLARQLRNLGIGPEARVGLCLERSIEAVVAVFGILKAGGAYVPLDPGLPLERIAEILVDCGAQIVLTDERLRESIPNGTAKVFCMDRDLPTFSESSGEAPMPQVRPSNAAYLIYTSGSTGKPKGVVVNHSNAVASTWARFHFYLNTVKGFLLLSPFAFDSSVAGIFWTLSQGGRLCIPQEGLQRDAEALAELTVREQLSHVLCLPALYNLLLDAARPGQLDTLCVVIVAGETCPPALLRRHFQCLPETRFYNEYGPTEGTVWSSAYEILPEDAESRRSISIGQPIANTRVYLLDSRVNPVPIGVPGELYIGGAGVARCYHGCSELTAERFVPDPFGGESGGRLYRTGDLARWRTDGRLEFLGRADQQVKIRGFRIELGEIETRLLEHPEVAEAVVVAREDRTGAKRLVAYWVSIGDGPSELSTEELRAFMKTGLPNYMVPSIFIALAELPCTTTGKIDRANLPQPDLHEQFTQDYIAPRTPVETRLASIWAELLRIERIGIHDNFFNLGGDSILVIQTVIRVRQAGLQITPRQLFQYQTIAELAAVVVEGLKVNDLWESVEGKVPLTPIQHWFFEQHIPNPHHWNQAVMLEALVPLDRERIERAVGYLVAYHDALRLRFIHDETGWYQYYAAEQNQPVWHMEDLSGVHDSQLSAVIEARAAAWQKQLDITQGPLLRVVQFETGPTRSARLLIVIHHLAIDGVSWRILLDDLHTIYRQLTDNQTPALPPKTASYKAWSEYLQDLAESEEIQQEAEYWHSLFNRELPDFPVDNPEGSNIEAVGKEFTILISKEKTNILLQRVTDFNNSFTFIEEALLAALSKALYIWNGINEIQIDVDLHGRTLLSKHLDLCRSVGWFTNVVPVVLTMPLDIQTINVLSAVKEQLHRIPNKGIGYGLLKYLSRKYLNFFTTKKAASIPVLFNYLGRLDQTFPVESKFCLARESISCFNDPQSNRGYEFIVDVFILNDQLQITWRYSGERYYPSTIKILKTKYEKYFYEIIEKVNE
jgi:fengycin family lipopeptide synthetase B